MIYLIFSFLAHPLYFSIRINKLLTGFINVFHMSIIKHAENLAVCQVFGMFFVVILKNKSFQLIALYSRIAKLQGFEAGGQKLVPTFTSWHVSCIPTKVETVDQRRKIL